MFFLAGLTGVSTGTIALVIDLLLQGYTLAAIASLVIGAGSVVAAIAALGTFSVKQLVKAWGKGRVVAF